MLEQGADPLAQIKGGKTPYELIDEVYDQTDEPNKLEAYNDIQSELKKEVNNRLQAALEKETSIDNFLIAGGSLRNFSQEDKLIQKERKRLNQKLIEVSKGKESNKVLIQILQSGASANSRGAKGEPPLHIKTTQGDQAAIKILISHEAAVNLQDQSCNTPVHTAVITKQTKTLPILIACGADIQIKSNDSLTPANLAKKGLLRVIPFAKNKVVNLACSFR